LGYPVVPENPPRPLYKRGNQRKDLKKREYKGELCQRGNRGGTFQTVNFWIRDSPFFLKGR